MDAETLGVETKRFILIRTSFSLSQEEFADKLGISAAVVRKIERGAQNVTLDIAKRLHEVYGISLDYIYGLADDPTDSATTVLMYFRNLFHYQNCPGEENPHVLTIQKTVIDFLQALVQADQLLEEGMPQSAYNIWVQQLKANFDTAVMLDKAQPGQRYRLVPETALGATAAADTKPAVPAADAKPAVPAADAEPAEPAKKTEAAPKKPRFGFRS